MKLKSLLSAETWMPEGYVALSRAESPASIGKSCLMMACSLPFAGIGVMIILMGMGHIEVEKNASDDVIIGCGCLFLGFGLLFFLRGCVQLPAAFRNKVTPPWTHLRCWSHLEVMEQNKPSLLRAFIGTLIVVAFFTPFGMFFLGDEFTGGIPWMFVVVFSVFGIAILYGWIRALKYAPSVLRLPTTPLLPTGQLTVELHCERPPTVPNGLTATLHYVEQYEVRSRGRNSGSSTVHKALFTHKATIPADQCPAGVLPNPLVLNLEMGDEPSFVTDWSGKRQRYWHLKIHADTLGVDYRCDFVLPVFAEDPQ